MHEWMDDDAEPINLPESTGGKYDRAFKLEVLYFYRDHSQNLRETAEKFNILPKTLDGWIADAGLPKISVKNPHVYSDRDKGQALLLHEMGEPVNDIARRTGIPAYTLRSWIRGIDVSDDALAIKDGAGSKLGQTCLKLATDIAASITEDVIAESKLHQRVDAMTKLVSVGRLFEGKPTSISESHNISANLSDLEAVARLLRDIQGQTREPIQIPDSAIIDVEAERSH